MRTTSRFLAAAAGLLALAALPFAGCGDAGDDGGAPVGPSAQYVPGMDLTGSILTAEAEGDAFQGGVFTILATFRDGQNRPVEGMSVYVTEEENGGCFGAATNPTLTNENGRCSIPIGVSADCFPGSYTITVFTAPVDGPRTETFVHVFVGASSVAAVTSVTLQTTTPTVEQGNPANFIATATATASCTVSLEYQAVGPGVNVPWSAVAGNPALFQLTPTGAGSLTVLARAQCAENPGVFVLSDPVSVTVTAPAGP